MREWEGDTAEGVPSVNPQSLFMLLSNDGDFSLHRAGNGTNICEENFYFTVGLQYAILKMLCDLNKVCENSNEERRFSAMRTSGGST